MPMSRFFSVGFDKSKLIPRMKHRGIRALLLTSPEDVFDTTGYTALPSSGNPILYTLRNRLPSFSVVDCDRGVTLLCWGFSAQGVEFGADQVMGFNHFVEALELFKSVLTRKDAGEGLIGITSSCPYFALQAIEECALRDKLVVVDDLMEELRLIKSSEEILRLRGNGLLLGVLALRGGSEDVHVVAAEHGRRIGVLSAGVRIDLRVEHQHFHVRPILQHHLRSVLVADVADAAVAAHHPNLG